MKKTLSFSVTIFQYIMNLTRIHSYSQNCQFGTFYKHKMCYLNFFFFSSGTYQARGQIGAIAASLHHSHSNATDPSHVCNLHHNSQQCLIPDPLSEARDQTCISWILVIFVSAAPQLELPKLCYLKLAHMPRIKPKHLPSTNL